MVTANDLTKAIVELTQHRLVPVALAVGLLAACGGGTKAAADPRGDAGCPTAPEKSTQELYVRALYDCAGNDLYVFADSSARDDWSKAATHFGSVEIKRGSTWILAKP